VPDLPIDFPDYLRHTDADAPVPTWAQVTHSTEQPDQAVIAQMARVIGNTGDEQTAHDVWDSWPGNYQRSAALIIEKIRHQGWLDSIDYIDGWPWDGGFFFQPRTNERGTFADVLNSKSGTDQTFLGCNIHNGLFTYLNGVFHKAWQQGWVEIDVPTAAFHIGLMADGRGEIHVDIFNPLFINGAPRQDLVHLPLLGTFNYKMFKLHRRWEQSAFAGVARSSANFYYMMSESVPLWF
jgi:hypothetical protein